jgi:hypothetical protein
MAIKKKRGRKAAPPPPKRGRKKELKRFEMETWGPHTQASTLDVNEVAFVIRTSGGSPLNASDVKKLFRILQHEIRSLGHHLKRKGQPLDPAPKASKKAAPAEDAPPEPTVSDDGPEAESEETRAEPDPRNEDYSESEPTVDPDDSDSETQITA